MPASKWVPTTTNIAQHVHEPKCRLNIVIACRSSDENKTLPPNGCGTDFLGGLNMFSKALVNLESNAESNSCLSPARKWTETSAENQDFVE